MKTCTKVTLTPEATIEWLFNDDSVETTEHDLSTDEGLHEIAARAVALGLGCKRCIIERLTHQQPKAAPGVILEAGTHQCRRHARRQKSPRV